MTDQEKLRVMLGHWIEHNREHAADFLRWVDRAGPAAEDLRAAADGMEQSNRRLAQALERLGGPLAVDTGPGHEHDHDHRHGHAGEAGRGPGHPHAH